MGRKSKIKRARKISDEEFKRQYAELQNAKPQPELRATETFYDPQRKTLVVRLENGSTITTPISALSEFSGANANDISAVQIRPGGTSLHWERLDQDFTVGGLIASVFGPSALMAELGRKGGSVITDAKATAARENGRKGGRPANVKKEALPFILGIEAQLLQAQIDLVEVTISGGSQMSYKDLVRYDAGLISAHGVPGALVDWTSIKGIIMTPLETVYPVTKRFDTVDAKEAQIMQNSPLQLEDYLLKDLRFSLISTLSEIPSSSIKYDLSGY